MSLSWPWALAALAAFPALLGYRWWLRRRRRRTALHLSSVALVRAALPGRSLWRRRIPIWLFAAGLVVLSVGAARPQASVVLPSSASSILLVIDESGSMCSTDVAPNRLTAAENAASAFVKARPSGTKIGLVVFSGIAALRVPPTTDKDALVSAISNLTTSRGGTAIGLGILTAIDAIASINPAVAPTGVDVSPSTSGGFQPDAIVVLTDGANNAGIDPVTAAQQAAARKLRIYTIGFGTTEPAPMVCAPNQLDGSQFGGGGFGGGGFGGGGFGGGGGGFGGGPPGSVGGGGGFGGRSSQELDVDTLTQVANLTGGKYFAAKDAQQLTDTLMNLPNVITLQHGHAELTVWFALAGALLVLVALALAQWWATRVRLPQETAT